MGGIRRGIFAVYEDYVYTVGSDLETRSVVRISLDGSKKEKVADIGNVFIDEQRMNHLLSMAFGFMMII